MTLPLAVAVSSGPATGSGSWTLLVIYFCLAIGVSFFCSVFEAVLLSVTRPFIAHLKKERPKTGADLEELKTHIDRPLTSILTLNTIAHTMGAMGVAGQVSAITGGGIWETISSALMTLAVLIASEIIPKNLGARNWKKWAPWVTKSLKWLCVLMTPIVKVIGWFSKGGHGGDSFSRDELRIMAELGRREGMLQEEESRIIHNLLQFREIQVGDVATPRTVVFAVDQSMSIDEFMDQHAEVPFSRIPLFGEDRDDITGFVLKDDILLAAARDDHGTRLTTLKRDVPSMSELTPVSRAFRTLTSEQAHIAMLFDEFGGMTGLVTVEDIVETLLGLEIVDELDTRTDMRTFARGLWERRARRMNLDLSTTGGDSAAAPSEQTPPKED